jgi:hypothetical protein
MTIIWKVETIFIPLGLYQLESIIIIIDALISCTCNSILENCDIFSNTCISKKIVLKMHIKTCGYSILCNEVKELIVNYWLK